MFGELSFPGALSHTGDLSLENGCRVAVIGGGPAGSFFAYFFLETAARVGLQAQVHIYEPKDLHQPGPAGCNMCGGIVSESLVQLLSTEGMTLPTTVVQRGIDSYVLHMDVGSVRIDPPGHEKRIAAVHRGGGPRGLVEKRWDGLDGYLLHLAIKQGATVVREKVDSIAWDDGKPRLLTKTGSSEPYDLLVAAVGVNGQGMKLFQNMRPAFVPPRTTKTAICEFLLGAEMIGRYLGSSMHVFLLNQPNLEFGALIPKGDYVTLVLLGKNIDRQMVTNFLNAPEVRQCFPPEWNIPADFCRCFPSINVKGAPQPFADRVVFVGDSGENRLYKDGIGGAYRTAKAAANTAVFEGVSAADFRRRFQPVCRSLSVDNAIGKLIFTVTRLIQTMRCTRRGIARMVAREQQRGGAQRMSGVLWDTFTGSAPYRDIFVRTLHPFFLLSLAYETARGFLPGGVRPRPKEEQVKIGDLGKTYRPGEIIVREGEPGDCMYVIQSGKVEVIKQRGGKEVRLAELGEGDFFGEMALFDREVRSATVRPLGEARILTVDKKIFLRKIHEDPSLAFRIMTKMSRRIREADDQLAQTARA